MRDLSSLTTQDLRAFLVYLRTLPNRSDGTHIAKSVYNAWVALRSFFRWYSLETKTPNPSMSIPSPKASARIIEPLGRDEVARLINACDSTKQAATDPRAAFTMRRETAHRDQAIVLVMLDTGLRATELCNLRVGDVDLSTGRVTVRLCKGGKDRITYVGKVARKALWR
jgi:integrase/recombinase XerD